MPKKSKQQRTRKIHGKHPENASDSNTPRWIPSFFTKATDHPFFAPAFSIIFFLAMLFISYSYHKIGDYGVETDFYWTYVPEARQVIEGHIPISSFRGPVYPIVLAFFNGLIGEFFKSGILLSVLSAGLVVFFTYQIIKRLFRNDLALWTVLLLTTNPIFIQYTYTAGTDMFFNAIVTSVLYLLLITSPLTWMRLIGIAILSGLAYLTRYNGVFILLAVPAGIFLIDPKQLNLKKRLLFSALFVVFFMIVISPWGMYCLKEKGDFFYNQNYRNIAFELYGKGKMSWDEFWFGNKMDISSFADIIVRSPKLFISKTIGNIPDHFINDLSKLTGWHIGILVIAGLGSLFLNKLNRLKTTYYLFNLCFFGMLLLIFYGQRFSLFLIPFYIVTALQVFIAIEKRLIRKTTHGYLIQIALTILLVFSWMRSYSFNQKNIRSGPREILSIAQWFDRHISETNRGSTVSARKPHIAYYLGLDFVRIPFTHSYRELIEELKKKKTDYLYIGMIEASTRRELQFLLDPGRTPPELRPVVYTRIPPSVLYQIRYE